MLDFLQEGIVEFPSGQEKWWKAASATPLKRGIMNRKTLARANGTLREIDCKAIVRVGRVKNICQWVCR